MSNEFILLEYVENDSNKNKNTHNRSKRITDPTMTQNEYTKLLLTRAKQIQLGEKPLIDIEHNHNNYAIESAKREINQRVIPFVIVRKLYDGKKESGYREEIWNIRELNIRDY